MNRKTTSAIVIKEPFAKRCSKCKLTKDSPDFYKSKNSKDGRRGRCRSCCIEDNLEAYHKNEEQNRQRVREFYRENTEKCKESAKRWYYDPKNKDRIVENRKIYRALNRDELLTRLGEWRQKNLDREHEYRILKYWSDPEKYRKRARDSSSYETLREWRRTHKEEYLLQKARRRVLKMNCKGVCTPEQLKDRVDFYGRKCAYCVSGKFESVDHVIPLVDGGTNWPSNLRPSCRKCNSMKGRRSLSDFLSILKHRQKCL